MLVARAWRDAGYRSELMDNPRGTFAAAGIALPEEVAITVTCDSELELNLLLGDEPASGGLSVAALPETPDLRSVFAHIGARCREDRQFKAEFLADPTGTVRSLGGVLAPAATVTVHIARPNHAFFNVPLPPRAQVSSGKVRAQDGGSDEAPLYFPIPLNHRGATVEA